MVKSERDQHSKEIFRASQVDPSNRKSKTSFVIHQAIKAIREVQGGTRRIKDAQKVKNRASVMLGSLKVIPASSSFEASKEDDMS